MITYFDIVKTIVKNPAHDDYGELKRYISLRTSTTATILLRVYHSHHEWTCKNMHNVCTHITLPPYIKWLPQVQGGLCVPCGVRSVALVALFDITWTWLELVAIIMIAIISFVSYISYDRDQGCAFACAHVQRTHAAPN